MKISVIGVGGVGGYFGGLLAKAGADVEFVARGEHYQQLAAKGLKLNTVEGSFEIPLRVVDRISKLKNTEVVLVTTKTYDNEAVAAELAEVVTADSVVIPIQNGISNDIFLQESLPLATVYPGLAYIISSRVAPGEVSQTAGPRTIIFGERKVAYNAQLSELEALMKSAGLLATASGDIERELWRKFAWLTTFAGMTSLCRCPIGPIVNDERALALLIKCLDEALAVAAAEGSAFSEEERNEMVSKTAAYRTANGESKSSMLVDLENRRRTEIESLNGTIVKIAKRHGIKVPTHEAIAVSVEREMFRYLNC